MGKAVDQELIIKAQAGDQTAFAALADRHYMTVYRFAFKWCRSKEDAEDITQEVFIKLGGKLHLFDGRSKFTSWLYRITSNCATDFARKNSKWTNNKISADLDDGVFASSNPGPEKIMIGKGILTAIGELPDKLQEAMLLVYAEGMNHKEAAQVMGCAETTVSWRIFQAKRKLRKVLS